jgi:MFS family permease
VLLVGLTLGLMRTVVPALAEDEFGIPRGAFVLLGTFVLAFGLVKAALNFVAGHWSERVGRRRVLVWGWLAGLPVPVLIWAAPSWGWIVAATVLLGVQQGLCWSMTQTAKLDLTLSGERGLIMGLNEFAGYAGVALSGVLTAYAAGWLGPRSGLLALGLAILGLGLVLALATVRETRPWALAEAAAPPPPPSARAPRLARTATPTPGTLEVMAVMTWRDRRLAALCQAGHVEKFVDALIWILVPAWLFARGAGLTQIGWVVGTYGVVWGLAQLLTGPLSDRVGRFWPTVLGMWICGAGVALFPLGSTPLGWSGAAALAGLGMALLYPNLSAAVADLAPPGWRGAAIGVYRFWRDLGYATGALVVGLAAWAAGPEAAFAAVALAMAGSGALLWLWGEETHPGLIPPR